MYTIMQHVRCQITSGPLVLPMVLLMAPITSPVQIQYKPPLYMVLVPSPGMHCGSFVCPMVFLMGLPLQYKPPLYCPGATAWNALWVLCVSIDISNGLLLPFQ